MTQRFKIGIDLGGTKIFGAVFDGAMTELATSLSATPRNDYDATLKTIKQIIDELFVATRQSDHTIGIAIPGSVVRASGIIQNANSTWLNGKPLQNDLEQILSQPVRLANDANCFALSEAVDGAGSTARIVLGVILGTGCGAGLTIDQALYNGAHNSALEWGHTPLPWPNEDEYPGPPCWCGKSGCLETWIAGPAMSRDHELTTGHTLTAEAIYQAALSGENAAHATLARHLDRLARGLGAMITLFDPDAIVLGGGLSNMDHLYTGLPKHLADHIFAASPQNHLPSILPPGFGATSGVRGAARLWDT